MPEELHDVPEDAEARPLAWDRLIRTHFYVLRQAVDRRDRGACERVEAVLVRWWDDAISLDGTAGLLGIPPERLDAQWRSAGHLARCARWILKQPPDRAWGAIDQAIARAVPRDLPEGPGFDPVTTWGWIASLREARVAYGVKVPVVLIEPMRPGAVVAELRLELIEDVVGGAFADPEQAVAGVFAAEFREAMALAWDAAARALRAEAGDADDRRFLAAGRYRLVYPGTVDPARAVEGRSAGGAAAYGWWHAFRQRQPDPSVAVLAEVVREEGGWDDGPRFRLASVEGLADKVRALADSRTPERTIDTIVGAGREGSIDSSPRIITADEVSTHPDHGLLARRSASVDDLIAYLVHLSNKSAELPTYFPEHLRYPGGFDRIRQRVQVIEDRRVWERWWAEQRERSRSAGQDADALAYDPTRARPEYDAEDPFRRGRSGRTSPGTPETVIWDDRAAERFRRAVLLGDPGFGKSWLLRHEARRIAGLAAERLRDHRDLDDIELPILVRLYDLGVRLARPPYDDPAALARLAVNDYRPDHPRLERFVNELQTRINRGKAVVLFDAWDEVHPDHKLRLRGWLQSAAANHPNWRLLVTSRIVGYPGGLVPGAQELELHAFDRDQVDAFVAAWLEDEPAARLGRQIQQAPSVRGLSRIPLMLSLICRDFQKQLEAKDHRGAPSEIPTRRTELYRRCLRGLLGDWKAEKQATDISPSTVEAMLDLWSGVALRQFEQGEEQVGESRLREMVQDELEQLIREKPLHELRRSDAASLIEGAKKDGMLIATGQDGEAPLLFLHRTFQEYLAARALASQVERGGWTSVAERLDRWSWHPRWEPVILLLAGEREDPRPLLELLADERTDDVYRHRMVLAALCLGELDNKTLIAEQATVKRVADDAATVWGWLAVGSESAPMSVFALKRRPFRPPSHDRMLPVLLRVDGRIGGMPAIIWCLQRLGDGGDVGYWVSRDFYRIRESIQEVGAAAATRDCLDQLALMLDHGRDSVRREAREVVTAMGDAAATPAILDRLAEILKAFLEGDSPWEGGDALRNLGPAAATPAILDQLTRMLDEQDSELRTRALLAVGHIGIAVATPAILDRLTSALGDRDAKVRAIATDVVRKLGPAAVGPALLDGLAQLLDDHEWVVSHGAKSELERISEQCFFDGLPMVSPTLHMLQTLLNLLNSDNNDDRYRALKVIQIFRASAATTGILDRLTQLLDEPDKLVRQLAHEAVGSLGSVAATPEILNRLAQELDSSNQESIISYVPLRTLWGLGPAAATPEILERLADLLMRWGVHETPAEMLSRTVREIGGTDAILDRFSSLIESRGRGYHRAAAGGIRAMGSTAATPKILDLLTDMLGEQVEAYLRPHAAKAVGGIGAAAATPRILDRLARMLEATDHHEASAAAVAVRELGPAAATPAILHGLARLLDEGVTSPFTSMEASDAIRALGAAAAVPAVLDRLVRHLQEEDEFELRRALETVEAIGPAAASPAILDRLAPVLDDRRPTISLIDPHVSMRDCAVRAVCALGPAAASPAILDRLVRMLDEPGRKLDQPTIHEQEINRGDHKKNDRELAIEALGSMGAPAAIPAVLDRFIQLTCDWDVYIRRFVAEAVEKMGPAAARSELGNHVGSVYGGFEDPFMEYQFLMEILMRFGLRFFVDEDGHWESLHVDQLCQKGHPVS